MSRKSYQTPETTVLEARFENNIMSGTNGTRQDYGEANTLTWD